MLVSTFVGATLALLIAFNVPLTEGQTASILALIAAGSAVFARSQVSPVAKLEANDIVVPE